MESWSYDLTDIEARALKARRVIKDKEKRVRMRSKHPVFTKAEQQKWVAKRQIGQVLANLDVMIQKLHMESMACNRRNARTEAYKHLIQDIEQTTDELDQLTTLFALEFFK